MGNADEIAGLLADLERTLGELERIHDVMAAQTAALAAAAASAPIDRPSVYSIRQAADALGVSASMVHKLMRERRLGCLKIGTRTVITADQLARFLASSQVQAG